MHDMHCHLAFMSNGEDVAAEAQAENTLLFANTVTMDEYETARKRFEAYDNVRVGLGTHPWWVDDSFDAARFEKLANRERFIGEIGLDLGRRHEENRQAQLDAFNTAIGICAHQGNKVVSLHAVHASAEVLGALERTDALQTCMCIFHWFTGPSDLLKRAILAGCRFSVGPRMLATGKGREYVKAIPAQQLLLETDAPPQQGQRYSYAELRAELEGAADTIAAIKGESALEIIEQNARTLLA
ncbi:MAG: TatD family hydrolase [Eggerthellaceae bacterium]|nr:TatD family hydrolase [Eggerthellaceae bacterium]